MRFVKGDKVVQRDSLGASTNYSVNEVVSFLDGDVLTKFWGDGFGAELQRYDFLDDYKPGDRNWRSGIQRFLEEELCTPEEALQELARLETANSILEQEFGKVRDQIKTRLDKAVELVKEAHSIAESCEKDFSSLKAECRPLFQALNEAGWRASSMSC